MRHLGQTLGMRVVMLAPMDIELQPLIRRLDLQPDDELGGAHRGPAHGHDVVAIPTSIGMAAGAAAAQRAIDLGAEHVMVVGIAGAIALDTPIGAVLDPEAVIDRASGRRFEPFSLGTPRAGLISCGDDLIVDRPALAALAEEGIIALDMETAAVAAVCDDAGVPWTVYRSISDRAGEGLIDPDLFAMTKPDGSADPDALARMLEDPKRRAALERLAHDATVATEAAAAAAIAALARL